MVAETRAELGVAVAILEACHRCGKQRILVFRVAQLARLPAMRPRVAALDPVASGDGRRRAGGGGAVRLFFHDLVVAFAVTILVLGVPLWGGWWIGKVMKLESPLEAKKPATWSVNELER